MIVQCRDCDEKFDDKYYIQNENDSGFHSMLISHAEFHEEEKLIQKYFVRKQKE